MAKKWYESGWVWLGVGAGLYILLRSRKASAAMPTNCVQATPDMIPHINKLKEAANNVYGPGSTGNVCVEIRDIPGTLDERTDITLQVFIENEEDVISLDLETLKTRSMPELTQSILALQG